jgi:hypothetical protein
MKCAASVRMQDVVLRLGLGFLHVFALTIGVAATSRRSAVPEHWHCHQRRCVRRYGRVRVRGDGGVGHRLGGHLRGRPDGGARGRRGDPRVDGDQHGYGSRGGSVARCDFVGAQPGLCARRGACRRGSGCAGRWCGGKFHFRMSAGFDAQAIPGAGAGIGRSQRETDRRRRGATRSRP